MSVAGRLERRSVHLFHFSFIISAVRGILVEICCVGKEAPTASTGATISSPLASPKRKAGHSGGGEVRGLDMHVD